MTVEERIQDIKDNPEKHKHNYEGLTRCSMHNGAVDLRIMEAHSDYVDLGTNGGTRCDVLNGPCACGAWHGI